MDDNEYARYLASYIMANLKYDWDYRIIVDEDVLYKLINEFQNTLP